jgi:anti-sigma B factor antagonist
MQSFELKRSELRGGYLEVSVHGELDLAVAGLLDAELASIGADHAGVVIGLGGCEFIDSTGIAVILRARRRFMEEGRFLAVCCPHDQTERILEITGLTDNGPVYATMEEALAAASAAPHEDESCSRPR